MNKITNEHSKSIEEIYNFIDLIEGYLRGLEKRVAALEKNTECDEYYEWLTSEILIIPTYKNV